ncbi:hypothetical protein LXL04_038577 [Taraxacum kok-saghyz]
MDPHNFIARAEAQRWLGIAEKLLTGRDFIGAKTFAIRARESDPRLEASDQILAIADTLLAAEKRVVGSSGTQQPDYYEILQLVRFVQDTEHIADQYRQLAVTLNPHQNRFPYSDQAFQVVNDAWAVLSNPLRKSMYDGDLDFPQQEEMNHIGFNLEQNHHHQLQQQQHHHQHQQQHQHNFFSINRRGSGHEQELAEQQPTFQTRVQRSHQQHNFMSQPNPVRPSPVRDQEHLFQQREQEELFQPQVQPFHVTSTPHQQSPQPPQPQPPMRSPTPPPRAASPQPPLSWPQAPPHSQRQPPIESTTPPSPPPVASPQPPVSWAQPPPNSQPQPRIRSRTPPPPPPAPPQIPMSWPQAPSHSQPQPSHPQAQSQRQEHQHLQPSPQPQPKLKPERPPQPQQEEQHQQQERPEQNATPVQPPTQINTNNGVSDKEEERVIESDSENVDASPTFWTACPYCLYMYEHPRVYADCTLRCSNCERAFQAVPIPSPPIIEDQEAYFCCWGSIPLGISLSHLEKNNGKATTINTNWTSISPLYDISSQIHDQLNTTPAKQNRNWGPRIYKDDVTDDIFTGVSDPSDDSDLDWNGTNNSKVKKKKKKKKRGRKRKAKALTVKTRKKRNKNLQDSTESSKTPLVSNSNPRRQSGRVAKELGKLDLNVEFNNNEGEEHTSKNRGQGQGEEDNIEGNGFFEGLDEFLSSLPILSVVNEEKVKAS